MPMHVSWIPDTFCARQFVSNSRLANVGDFLPVVPKTLQKEQYELLLLLVVVAACAKGRRRRFRFPQITTSRFYF